MKYFLLLNVFCFLSMCNSNKSISENTKALAPLIIYKTKADYSNNIPITLNDKKDIIVSYPSVRDIIINGQPALPDKLSNGFLLDNLGVSPNTVYTSYTFEEYAKLKEIPAIEELKKRIIDYDPIIEMYNCGKRVDFKSTKDINTLINSKLKNCIKLK
jgi:ABC-type Fe3+-hydroxamate transport system substrate-binding protein